MSDLARQLIAENKRSKATFLDLGRCGLTELPAEVGELVWLEGISLADIWAEWDGPARRWEGRRNRGDENNRLIDIGPLAGLRNLRRAMLGQVANLTPLTNLAALRELSVSGASDLAPIAKSSTAPHESTT
jgi:internalin A